MVQLQPNRIFAGFHFSHYVSMLISLPNVGNDSLSLDSATSILIKKHIGCQVSSYFWKLDQLHKDGLVMVQSFSKHILAGRVFLFKGG